MNDGGEMTSVTDASIPDLINSSSGRVRAVHSSQTGLANFAGLYDDIVPSDIQPPGRDARRWSSGFR